MNFLDFVLGGIVLYCLIRGVFRGLAKELSSIIGVLGGLYAAYTYYPFVTALLSPMLSRWITDPGYLHIIASLSLFFCVYLVVSVLGVMIKYFLNIVFLGWADRLCGALFGGVKGLLISCVLIVMLTAFLPKNTTVIKESIIARRTARFSTTLIMVASKDMKQLFSNKMKEMNKTWNTRKM